MKEIEIDGKTFEYDAAKLMSSEMKVIQKYTGMTFQAWHVGLGQQDPYAVDALVWLVRSRSGEPEAIGDFDYNMRALILRDLDEPDEDVEADPTLTTSDVSSPESTDETPELNL